MAKHSAHLNINGGPRRTYGRCSCDRFAIGIASKSYLRFQPHSREHLRRDLLRCSQSTADNIKVMMR
nr:hypothetical protein CFP56_22368 [Quercus suber]